MKGSSGNGDPPRRYELSRSDFYTASRDNIEWRYPRVRQVRLFDQIEACLQLFPPPENAERVKGSTWVLATQEGVNIPEIDVYFTFEDSEITLEQAWAG